MRALFAGVVIVFCARVAFAQPSEIPSEVLAVSVGILTKGSFNSGALPWSSNEPYSGSVGKKTGTSVLLLARLPSGQRVLSQGHRLFSFVDDTGKNLAQPSGVTDGEAHGFADDALAVITNEAGKEAIVAIRSPMCPGRGATKISGEVEISLAALSEESAESLPVQARVGAKTTVGPLGIEIIRFGPMDAGRFPPGSLPDQSQNQKEIGIQLRPASPDTIVIRVELLDGMNKAPIRQMTPMDAAAENGTYLSPVSPGISSVMFRVAHATGKSKTTGLVRFSTGLGINGE